MTHSLPDGGSAHRKLGLHDRQRIDCFHGADYLPVHPPVSIVKVTN